MGTSSMVYFADEEGNLLSHQQCKYSYTVWDNEFMKVYNMVEHFIVSGSSYKKGTRIAVHKSYIEGIDQNEITAITEILKKHPEVIFSFHYIVTDDVDWSSVVAYDPFFQVMEIISDIEQFIKLIS